MPGNGHYITIGLNSYDPVAYESNGFLHGPENDARDMATIAKGLGYSGAPPLLTEAATSVAVLDELRQAAAKAEPGDLVLVTYSGHGGFVPDKTGDEPDASDETWCLYDRQLLDDELHAAWANFKAGVRIFVLSDSCHSGTSLKSIFAERKGRRINLRSDADLADAFQWASQLPPPATAPGTIPHKTKALSSLVASRNYRKNQGMYDQLQIEAGRALKAAGGVKASAILISACQDYEEAKDGDPNSDFTAALKIVWAGGTFNGTYRDFCEAIKDAGLDPSQNPNYETAGAPNAAFENSTPFSL